MLNQSFTDFEIIFVDNASSDNSVDFTRANYNPDKIKIIRSDKNLGFAGGNNLGFRHCSGKYVVLLNNDTVTDPDWLKELIDCISENEKTGIAQSLVITEGIPVKYYKKNGTINLLGHNIMEVFEINSNGIGEIFQANGCSLIIRKSLADELGGLFLDEYFAYSEDTFLCFKVKFRGLKILHTSGSIVHHKGGGASADRKPSHLYFYQERNRLLNFIIFFPEIFFIKYIPYLAVNFFMKLTAALFSKKYSIPQLIKVYVWLISNSAWIKDERASLYSLKKINDNSVLEFISCKIFNGDNSIEKAVNYLSVFYCKLVRLNVLENKTRV